MTVGYCVKCRERVELSNEEKTEMKNGKMAIKGTCQRCGTSVFVILRPPKPDYW